MGKTPFQFKSTGKPAGEGANTVKLIGSSEVLATYTDTFLVLNEAATGMASIYFYQRQVDDRTVQLGTTATGEWYAGAKCVSRIVMAPLAVQKLLAALAENRGFTLTPQQEEPTQEEGGK
jgi:hypothetical protein